MPLPRGYTMGAQHEYRAPRNAPAERRAMTRTPQDNKIEVHSHAIRYVAPDGTMLAEVTFPEETEGTVQINHTFVDESLRGQGIAGMLLEQTARELKETHRKAHPTCSYAVGWFARHPEWAELVA